VNGAASHSHSTLYGLTVSWSLATVAVVLLAYAAVSGRLVETPVTAPMVFTLAGLVVGVEALGLVHPAVSSEPVKLLAEISLALVLFADASRIDLATLRDEISVPARLLGFGLPLTIVAGFGLALLVFGSFSWIEALLLAIVLAPTDAALGQAVVTLERIPARVRQGLNVESGLNDGICVPLLLIALGVATAETTSATPHAAARLVLEQIGYGVLGGIIAGVAAAAIVVVGLARSSFEPSWLQVVPLGGAALAYGVATPLGGSGFIAAFIAGAFFGVTRRGRGVETEYLIEQGGEIFGALTFIVFGAVLLAPALGRLSWAVVAYALLSLTLVRMVPVAIALLGTHARPPTVGFVGWFGPRGLASIVFAVLIEEQGRLPHEQSFLTAAYVTVGLSVVLHGLTAAPLATRYARWFQSHPRDGEPRLESGDVTHQRWRRSQ
jgi:NhaP-type Na+/H+ or K+/H+ antiporter